MASSMLVPPMAGDASMLTMEQLISRMGELGLQRLLVYDIENVASELLPVLAEQFGVAGYAGWTGAKDDAARRALLISAMDLHRFKGTPWALRRVFEVLGIEAQLSEWFEHDGPAYTFRVAVRVSQLGFDADALASLLRLINQYKNARSGMERLTVSQLSECPVYLAGSAKLRPRCIAYPKLESPASPAAVSFAAVGLLRPRIIVTPES